MKKLLKQEWKYYLFFALAVICHLFITGRLNPDIADISEMFANGDSCSIIQSSLYFLAEDVTFLLFNHAVIIISLYILLFKGMIFWVEKDSYGREFFQTLPIRRSDRVWFHFIMDSLLVILAVSAYAVFLYMQIVNRLNMQKIELPWLGKTICGEGITCICYILFLLGVINFTESVFVDGFIKIVGSVSMVGMSSCMLSQLLYRNPGNIIVQKLYGFFAMESVGGSYYSFINEDADWYSGDNWDWMHSVLQPEIFYKGESWDFAFTDPYLDGLYRFYDFSHCSSYIGYALAYFGLAIVLLGFAVRLSQKQELSKQGFYFSFGKYLFSVMFSGTFFAMMLDYAVAIWHKCFILVSAILICILLIFCMTPDRKWHIRKE